VVLHIRVHWKVGLLYVMFFIVCHIASVLIHNISMLFVTNLCYCCVQVLHSVSTVFMARWLLWLGCTTRLLQTLHQQRQVLSFKW